MIRWATRAELVAGLLTTGMPGQQRARGLLGQAPGREVEGVDVDGHAVARHRDVLAVEARACGRADALAVHQELRARPAPCRARRRRTA